MTIDRRSFLIAGAAASAASLWPHIARAAAPDRIAVDYAYYNPVSLILKQNGWLETELAKKKIGVDWVLSLGSNKANQFLQAGAVQFGSTAGSAAFLARANGTPLRTVYLYSQPEWTALVVGKDSPLRSVRDLKGKKVAATVGTDPWFFLLRSLREFGLDQADIQLVNLQHPDGRTALERGQVDAWAGLDPHMAASQIDAGSKLIYRNVAFNTYGALNVREDFLQAQPEIVDTVLRVYDRGRREAIAHPDETIKILAAASNVEPKVAELVIRERTHFPDPAPGRDYAAAIAAVVPIVRAEHLTAADANLEAAAATLADTRYAQAAAKA
jgi:sulfonate transport system substrate-binding protein